MKHWNQLETTLRSWTPRAPSQKLKARLFSRPEASDAPSSSAASDERTFSWQWFAPSTVLVFIATILLGHQGGMLGLSSSQSSSVISKQDDRSAYYVSARHSGNNNIPVVGLEWTNGSVALSGVASPTTRPLH